MITDNQHEVDPAHNATCDKLPGRTASMQQSLFADPVEIEATCPTCRGTQFNAISGTDKFRCGHCGWLVKVVNGKTVDAVAWTTAGRKRKGGRR